MKTRQTLISPQMTAAYAIYTEKSMKKNNSQE